MTRKICVVTATRAEYGLLKCLLEDIEKDDFLELQLIVTGTHLSPEFGSTQELIKRDKFKINKKIEILLSSDTPVGVCKSMGLAQISFAEAFEELNPDILLVLGDRYELLPIVSSANILRIPVAHLNGGELTEGAIDELFRHAITKLSQIHFTSIEPYAKRVIKMGEQPERVFNVGEVGLDNLKRINFLSKNDFEKSIGINLKKKNILITYHPVTTEIKQKMVSDFEQILSALDEQQDTLLIFTKANSDVGGRYINERIDSYVAKNPEKAVSFSSLGQERYLSALRHVDIVLGNSSSGIVEAPSFNLATINIGTRQKGRIRAESVIDIEADRKEILEAIELVYSTTYKEKLNSINNPYDKINSSKEIVRVLKDISLLDLTIKRFYEFN